MSPFFLLLSSQASFYLPNSTFHFDIPSMSFVCLFFGKNAPSFQEIIASLLLTSSSHSNSGNSALLSSLSSSCLLHNRPVIKRQVVGKVKRDFIPKSNWLRRWWTHARKNPLARVRVQAPFTLKGEGVKSCFPGPHQPLEGNVLILPPCSHS